MDWQHFPSCHWKTSSHTQKKEKRKKEIPFTTRSRPLTLIYVGSCFTVSKTVVAVDSEPNISGPTCMWHIYDKTQHNTHAAEAYLNVSWLFYARITVRPAHSLRGPCTKCLAPSHGKLSAHLILMHFISPPFPSAVPLIFHIRHLIITASRAICFWTNLPRFSNQYQQAGQMAFKLSLSLFSLSP